MCLICVHLSFSNLVNYINAYILILIRLSFLDGLLKLCRFFVGYGLTLSRVVPLIIFHLKKRFLCKTEEELANAWAPGSFNYATCVPGDMLILTITFCYAVIAPLILIFAIIYFGLGWLLMRNQVNQCPRAINIIQSECHVILGLIYATIHTYHTHILGQTYTLYTPKFGV